MLLIQNLHSYMSLGPHSQSFFFLNRILIAEAANAIHISDNYVI